MKIYEYIIAIAEEKSLLRASERVGVSSSALSQAISKIEEEVGTPLFTRSKAGWVLTPAGEIYLEMAYNVVSLHKESLASISLISENAKNTISIGISPDLSLKALCMVLPAFRAVYPNVFVDLFEANVLTILKNLEAQRLDIGILSACADFPTVNTQQISTDVPILTVPNSFLIEHNIRISDKSLLKVEDLKKFKDCSFLIIREGTTLRTLTDKFFEIAGFTPKTVFESASGRSIAALANIGYAAAIVPSSYAEYSQDVSYFTIDTPLRWNKYAAYPVNHKLTPAEDYLIDLLKSLFTLPHTRGF